MMMKQSIYTETHSLFANKVIRWTYLGMCFILFMVLPMILLVTGVLAFSFIVPLLVLFGTLLSSLLYIRLRFTSQVTEDSLVIRSPLRLFPLYVFQWSDVKEFVLVGNDSDALNQRSSMRLILITTRGGQMFTWHTRHPFDLARAIYSLHKKYLGKESSLPEFHLFGLT